MDFDQISKDLKNVKMHKWRRVWESFMRKYNCERVCELGVYKGENFMYMVSHGPKLAVAVDNWTDDGTESRNDAHYTQDELDSQFGYFHRLTKNLPFVQIVRDYTVSAAKKFPDNYFDFVYIDADHSYDGCVADIKAWYPKVKPGKFLVGHDYRKRYGVFNAVNEFIEENKLELIFLPPSTWAVVKK